MHTCEKCRSRLYMLLCSRQNTFDFNKSGAQSIGAIFFSAKHWKSASMMMCTCSPNRHWRTACSLLATSPKQPPSSETSACTYEERRSQLTQCQAGHNGTSMGNRKCPKRTSLRIEEKTPELITDNLPVKGRHSARTYLCRKFLCCCLEVSVARKALRAQNCILRPLLS